MRIHIKERVVTRSELGSFLERLEVIVARLVNVAVATAIKTSETLYEVTEYRVFYVEQAENENG
jgi:5-keto 4-deoxyuronate isomerase